jgi:hypothetical protein
MGSAEARWGWRVVDGDGTVSASDLGPAYSSLVLPFPTTLGISYGYPAYGCGYGYPSYAYGLSYGYGYRRLIMAAYYPRYRYAGYPYRRAYYGYGGYPYRRSQRAVACEVETTLKRPPSGGLCCFE